MQFQPGQSGNPGGRTKADREVVELAREASPRAIGRLVELVENENGRIAVAACTALLDRAFGKPTQPIAGDDAADPIRVAANAMPSVDALAKLSPEDRQAMRVILGRAMGDAAA